MAIKSGDLNVNAFNMRWEELSHCLECPLPMCYMGYPKGKLRIAANGQCLLVRVGLMESTEEKVKRQKRKKEKRKHERIKQ